MGGPLGAVLGAVAGEALGEKGDARARGRAEYLAEDASPEEKGSAFALAVISLLAKIAKADGRVSKKEVAVVDEFFKEGLGLRGGDRKAAIRIFEAAKKDRHSFEDLAIQIYQLFRTERGQLRNLLGILLKLGAADGRWHPKVEAKLQRVGRIFDFSDAEFAQMKAVYLHDAAADHAVLGLEPGASAKEVKRAYKKLALDFHPDRVATKDLPPAFADFARERFQRIQAAYEAIEAAREER